MEENHQAIKVAQRIREVFDKKSVTDMEQGITFSTSDAFRLFSCFQKILIINEIVLAVLGKMDNVSDNDTALIRHHAREMQGQAEKFILSALDKVMENNNE